MSGIRIGDVEALQREILAIRDRMDAVRKGMTRTETGEWDLSGVKAYGDISDQGKLEAFIADQQRLEALVKERDQALALERASQWLDGGQGLPAPEGKTADLARRIATSRAITEAKGSGGPLETLAADALEIKALMTTGSGYPPETLRSGVVAVTPTRAPLVLDLPPMVRTVQNAYKYMSETTFTNAAAAVAEGAAYPEAALAYTEVTMPIRKVAVHLPVTEEQLEDDAGVEDLIRGRLTEMVRLQMDSQLLSGTGVAPQLTGYRNVSGISALTQGGSEAVLDAIYRGIVSVRATGRAIPDAIIINPADLQTVRLAKTVDGVYLFGSPAVGPELPIWGVRVIETDAIPTKKVLVGDFARHSALVMRSGVDVQVGYATDGFIKGVKTIRLDVRAALAVFRPSAFCEVTLL